MSWLKINPIISTTALTCGTTAGSKTVTSSAAFGSVLAGQRVVGVGIPFMTKVASVETTSSLTLTDFANATSASVSLQFGYFTSAIYTAGDALGFPFAVPMKKINNIVVVDTIKVITAVTAVFVAGPFIETADNAAFAIADADARNIIGYTPLAVSAVFANNQLVTQATTALPIDLSGSTPYCQLIVVGTPTFTHVDDLTVNILGE